jgi:hypothetical protein
MLVSEKYAEIIKYAYDVGKDKKVRIWQASAFFFPRHNERASCLALT